MSFLAKSVFAFIVCGVSVAQAETSPWGQLLSPEATYRFTTPVETRIGVFAHEPSGPESGSADISGEVVFGNISHNADSWWSFATMRADIGGTYNTAGKTDGIYAGPIWTFALTDKLFLEASLGGAWNDGMTGPTKPLHRAGMGCHFGFHESLSLGYNITQHWSVMATAEHYSNLNLCDRNHGISNYGLRIGYSF